MPETNQATEGGQPVGLGNCPGAPCWPNAYNPNLPPNTYQAWVIRRTDQATGNPFMWFSADDGYVYGDGNQVQIDVTYWNRGTDRWQLKYQDSSGQELAAVPVGGADPWVQKTDSNTFLTASFVLTDTRMSNAMTGGADFVLDSRSETGVNDGNEWVHFVELKKLAGPAPQPTPTHTPTPTPTSGPTRTPTPTWTPVADAHHHANGDARRHQHADRDAQPTSTHTPTHTPHAYPHAHGDRHQHADSDADAHAHGNSDAHAHDHPDRDAHRHRRRACPTASCRAVCSMTWTRMGSTIRALTSPGLAGGWSCTTWPANCSICR